LQVPDLSSESRRFVVARFHAAQHTRESENSDDRTCFHHPESFRGRMGLPSIVSALSIDSQSVVDGNDGGGSLLIARLLAPDAGKVREVVIVEGQRLQAASNQAAMFVGGGRRLIAACGSTSVRPRDPQPARKRRELWGVSDAGSFSPDAYDAYLARPSLRRPPPPLT